jgi:hypothetical protein
MTREALAIGCAAGFGGVRAVAAGPVVDTHGKTLAFLLLGLEIEVPSDVTRAQ